MASDDSTSRPVSHSTGETSYRGRFAPSPSGPLHFGSLVCALASFLDARANHGQWLLRIEDIDPPREPPGAADAIVAGLAAHGLYWDGDVLLQSSRGQAYETLLEQLQSESLCYRCVCSRQRLQSLQGVYDGLCRRHPPAAGRAAALRLKVDNLPGAYAGQPSLIRFSDLVQGPQAEDVRQHGDFVIHRKDGLFAYQLAVVADDIAQGITHVVRGSDLLDTTARQIYLFHLLEAKPPLYAHLPVVVDQHLRKLSKQNHAPALDSAKAAANLWHACHCLGLQPPAEAWAAPVPDLLCWATEHWRIDRVPRQLTVPEP